MSIIERGQAFAKWVWELAARTAADWRQYPHCGSQVTIKHRS